MKKNKNIFLWGDSIPWRKTCRIMKVLLILLTSTLVSFATGSYSQTKSFTFQLKNANLIQIFEAMENQSDVQIAYDISAIDINERIDIVAEGESVEGVLGKILQHTDLSYKIMGRYIIIKKDQSGTDLYNQSMQTKRITGNVIDSNGQPMPGVTVVIKGTSNGTITDIDGNFTIANVPADGTLVFSFVGMQSQEISVIGKSAINVVLSEETIGLDEVVAIGYGVVRKTDVSSAVSSIKSEDFNIAPITESPMQMVKGKVAGLNITNSNAGDPNGGVSMQIRGLSSINAGTEPIVVVDGVVGGDLNTIPPQDIESIDVLRDGSAAAIYGARGTSGVIIVTTKKYKGKESHISYSGSVTIDRLFREPEMMNASDFRDYKESLVNSTNPAKVSLGEGLKDFGGQADAYHSLMNDNAVSQQHYLTFGGGTHEASYNGSINYRDVNGIVINTKNENLTGRLSADLNRWDDKLNIKFNLNNNVRNWSEISNTYPDFTFREALRWNPTENLTDPETGVYNQPDDLARFANPLDYANEQNYDYKSNSLLANSKVTIKPVKGLSVSGMVALENFNRWDKRNYTFDSHYSVVNKRTGDAYLKSLERTEKTLELTADYSKIFSDNSSLDILGGYSYYDRDIFWMDAENYNFVFDQMYYNIGAGSALKDGQASMGSFREKTKLISFFGRAIYSLKEKYIFNVAVRHEGSDRFGINNQWGTFPSGSFAWRVINEPFMKDQNLFSNLKLRLGYGVTGNLFDKAYLNYVLFAQQDDYTLSTSDGQTSWVPTWGPKTNANEDLKWETKREFNVGFDMGFLSNRLNVTLDYYIRKANDLIVDYQVAVPPYLADRFYNNFGTISNKGIEFSVNATPVKTKDFTWQVNLNGSYNSNLVESLNIPGQASGEIKMERLDSPVNDNTMILKEGEPIGNFWTWEYAGVDADGKILVYTQDRDSTYQISDPSARSDADRKVMGNGMPKLFLNMVNTFKYKDFDFSFMLRGSFMYDVLNVTRLYHETPTFDDTNNALKSTKDVPFFDDVYYTSYYLEPGDYVKLDNITLGWTKNLRNIYVSKIRLYFTAENVAFFSKYSGTDSELELSTITPGVDNRRDRYPSTSRYSLGVNITF